MISDNFNRKVNHFGLALKDKTIYYIDIAADDCGFFAVYRQLLEYLYFADICGYVPVVRYADNFPYAENHKVNGTQNPFEYYFEQPASMKVSDVRKCYNVILADDVHSDMVRLIFNGKYRVYDANKLYINQLARINRKYIKLNDVVKAYIFGEIGRTVGNEKVLGVHVRGSDFKRNYHIHPIYVSAVDYLNAAKNQFKTGNWDKVFIATDDADAVKIFEEEFGNKLIYYKDVFRTTGKMSVAFSEDGRKNHHYKLGLEVLRDVYTLAACDGLISGISQVSLCSRIIHISERRRDYEYLQCISNGINLNGKYFKKPDREQKENNILEEISNFVKKIAGRNKCGK